jgi:glutamate synthase domain-containing protein 2
MLVDDKAVGITIGPPAKPGLGGRLPVSEVTAEIVDHTPIAHVGGPEGTG